MSTSESDSTCPGETGLPEKHAGMHRQSGSSLKMIPEARFWEIDTHYSRACQVLDESKGLSEKYQYDLCVRRGQEAFELLLKTMFLFMGMDPPKEHDLTKALYDAQELLQNFGIPTPRIAQIVLRGKTLALWRDLAFYGDERLRVVALFGEPEGKLALRWAGDMNADCYLVKTQVLERFIRKAE